MNALMDRLNQWNIRMKGLPRKGMLVAATLLVAWLFFVLAPLCWPFLVAMLASMALEPLVSFCMKHLRRIRLPRSLITLLGMVLLYGVLGVGMFALIKRLIQELVSLAYATPGFVRWISATAVPYLQGLYHQYSDVLPTTAMTVINNGLSALGENLIKLAGTLSASLTGGAVRFTAAIPGIMLSIVLTIMGTYYMTADRERILAFFPAYLPHGYAAPQQNAQAQPVPRAVWAGEKPAYRVADYHYLPDARVCGVWHPIWPVGRCADRCMRRAAGDRRGAVPDSVEHL